MDWEEYLKLYPDTDVKTLGKPAEFRPPVKDKRTTPKGPGSLDKLVIRSRSASKKFGAKSDANIQQMRESWMGVKPVGARALQILTPSRDARPSTTQQLQRQRMTKSRRLGEARRSWQKQTENQRINSLSTDEPNPGNTSPKNPIVPGSNADAGKWTGSDEMWKDSQKSLEQGKKAWTSPIKADKKADKKTDWKKLSGNLDTINKGLKAAFGDRTKEEVYKLSQHQIDEEGLYLTPTVV